MMTKWQTRLLALFVVQLALVFVLRGPFGAGDGFEDRPMFPALESVQAARIELSDEDETVTLRRDDDGWVVEEFSDFPADAEKVGDLVDDLTRMKARRPLVRSAKYHGAFDLEENDPAGHVRVWGEDGDEPVVDLLVGDAANYRSLRVRRADAPEVYEVEGLAAYDVRADASAWIRKKLVPWTADEIVGLELRNEHGTFELTRGDGAWFVAGEDGREADAEKVEAFLGRVTGWTIADPLGLAEEHGPAAGSAAATVRLSAAGGETTIAIGGTLPDDDARRVVSSDELGFAATIWDSSVAAALDKRLADLLPAD